MHGNRLIYSCPLGILEMLANRRYLFKSLMAGRRVDVCVEYVWTWAAVMSLGRNEGPELRDKVS